MEGSWEEPVQEEGMMAQEVGMTAPEVSGTGAATEVDTWDGAAACQTTPRLLLSRSIGGGWRTEKVLHF